MNIKVECLRDFISESKHGVYMVQKRNVIKEFRWGETSRGQFADSKSANQALHQYLSQRKDSAELRVTALEFRNPSW